MPRTIMLVLAVMFVAVAGGGPLSAAETESWKITREIDPMTDQPKLIARNNVDDGNFQAQIDVSCVVSEKNPNQTINIGFSFFTHEGQPETLRLTTKPVSQTLFPTERGKFVETADYEVRFGDREIINEVAESAGPGTVFLGRGLIAFKNAISEIKPHLVRDQSDDYWLNYSVVRYRFHLIDGDMVIAIHPHETGLEDVLNCADSNAATSGEQNQANDRGQPTRQIPGDLWNGNQPWDKTSKSHHAALVTCLVNDATQRTYLPSNGYTVTMLILNKICARQVKDFIEDCVAHGGADDTCMIPVLSLSQYVLKEYGKSNSAAEANEKTLQLHAETPSPAPRPFAQRFADSNTTRDGCLTLQQAQAGGMNGVVKNFQRIDSGHKGCVLLDQIRLFQLQNQVDRELEANRPHPNQEGPLEIR